MSEYTFRLAVNGDRQNIINFMNSHWGEKHPLVNRPEFFSFYYENPDGGINFALGEKNGEIAAVCGFIHSSYEKGNESGWLSILLADKKMSGAGLELLCSMKELTGFKSVSCNNIRKKVLGLYSFAGYHTGRIKHYYRLASREIYNIARVENPRFIEGSGKKCRLEHYPSWADFTASGFAPPKNANPYKDLVYINKRYYSYPGQKYELYGIYAKNSSIPDAILVCRFSAALNSGALRIVDFLGDLSAFAYITGSIDSIMDKYNAEYCDIYCVVPDDSPIFEAGFIEREENSSDIIPNYLHPPLIANTEYYYAASDMENFTMFKADGDQDRPNTPV